MPDFLASTFTLYLYQGSLATCWDQKGTSLIQSTKKSTKTWHDRYLIISLHRRITRKCLIFIYLLFVSWTFCYLFIFLVLPDPLYQSWKNWQVFGLRMTNVFL